MRDRILGGLTLFATGLLAGMFAYGALNVAQAFKVVPRDVRFTFHVALMESNRVIMQIAMALAVLAALVLAIVAHGAPRRFAVGSFVLGGATFLVTMFGNVPINGQIRQWAKTSPPADYAEILGRWEAFHYVRTGTAVLMFVAAILAVDALRRARITAAVPS